MVHKVIKTIEDAKDYLAWTWINELDHDPCDDVTDEFKWRKEAPHSSVISQMYLRDEEIMNLAGEDFDPHQYLLDMVDLNRQVVLATVSAATYFSFNEVFQSPKTEGVYSAVDYLTLVAVKYEVKYKGFNYEESENCYDDLLCNFITTELCR